MTSAVANLRKIRVLRNLMATSRGYPGLAEIYGEILLQTTGIAIVTAEARRRREKKVSGIRCQVSGASKTLAPDT
jgi:NAD-dependent DNA ligase